MEAPIVPTSAPESLTIYHGGLNLGIFYPGPPNSVSGSELTGNQFGGKATSYRSTSNGEGSTNAGWAIILAPYDLNNFIMRKPDEIVSTKKVSYFDGLFNRNQTSSTGMSRVTKFVKGGYNDWYIPSANELAFIAKNLPKNFELDPRFSPMSANSYLSSTYSAQNIAGANRKKLSLLLAQSFYTPTYGDTIMVPDFKPMSVRLIRRVFVATI
jgi:hypothetical protein